MFRKYKRTPVNISNFTCERFSTDRHNKNMVEGFNSDTNGSLSAYLKRSAWFEDTNNKRVVYLVKDKTKIVMFFSLQCGSLIKCHHKVLHGINHRVQDNVNEYYIDDDIIDVTDVVPAIEISHFCINDSYRKRKTEWRVKNSLVEYRIGQYIFYKFIAPILIDTSTKIGVEKVYLFCADDGSGKLIKYYNELNFDIMDDMACIRSKYDNKLKCMTCNIKTLTQAAARFNDMMKADDIITYLKQNNSLSHGQAKRMGVQDPEYLFDQLIDKGIAVRDNVHKIRYN